MRLSIKRAIMASVVGGLGVVVAPLANASSCSLSSAGDTCTFPDSSSGSPIFSPAIYTNPVNTTIVGSGLVDPFLTVQANGNESGFTSDAPSNDLPLDAKRAEGNGQFTRTFTVSNLVNVGGYYHFFLDLNEPASTADIALALLNIYSTGSSAPVMLGSSATLASLNAFSLLYSLDTAGNDNTLNLNYNVFGGGSGNQFDLELKIPVSVFAGLASDTRIVFASAFSGSGDGFEEWWYQARGTSDVCPPGTIGTPPTCVIPPVTIPEPGSIALIGLSLAGLAIFRRRRD